MWLLKMLNKKFIIPTLLLLLCTNIGNGLAASTDSCFDITDTSLMLHMDGTDASTTFTDSDDGAKSITAGGDAQIDTAQQKFGTASGLFDGTGDYLSAADSTDWDFSTNAFTVDFWVRFAVSTSGVAYNFIGRNVNRFSIRRGGDDKLKVNINDTEYSAAAWTPATNTWYHIAVTRSGTDVKIFIDGTQNGATGTSSDDINEATAFEVGRTTDGTQYVNGWIEELRVVKGTAVWTANFTPPSAAYTQCATARRRVISTI